MRGEVYLAGGAVMCLVFKARPATKDINAMLVPPSEMRAAAQAVANREGLPGDWLNDAVKGFLSEHGEFELFEERSNLRIYYDLARYPAKTRYVLEELIGTGKATE